MFLNVSLMKVHVIVIMISCATRITLIHIASVRNLVAQAK